MTRILSIVAIAALGLALWSARGFADNQAPAGVSVGQKAPDFTLQDQTGSNVSLHDYAGKIVVLEWVNPNCPFVIRHYKAKTMQTVFNQFKDQGVAWVSVNSTKGTTNDADKQWTAAQSIPWPVLNDVKTDAGKEYHATNTPEMYIISKDGGLLYKGAIDNDPDGDMTTGKVNYVTQALSEIESGKTVSVPETKPYGCHVTYQN